MTNTVPRLAILLGLLGLAAIAFNWWLREQQEPPPVRQVQPAPQVKVEPRVEPQVQALPPAEPKIHYPIGEAAADGKPLPLLGDSDPALRESLSGLVEQKQFARWFYPDGIVRRLVATIDNLPREEAALRLMPVKPVGGRFDTSGDADNRIVSPENYRRYTPLVRLVETMDAKKLVADYVHFYPLFQRQYQELGYPTGYFNDRLVEVIDHLLAAPDVQGPVRLVRPRVLWKFADPKLESLSAGQKAMIRMGSDNAARVKAKLREIRRELTGQTPNETPRQ